MSNACTDCAVVIMTGRTWIDMEYGSDNYINAETAAAIARTWKLVPVRSSRPTETDVCDACSRRLYSSWRRIERRG
jgi:hypothetical protein